MLERPVDAHANWLEAHRNLKRLDLKEHKGDQLREAAYSHPYK